MSRPVIAFLVAPLVVPLFLLPSLYSGMPDRFWFAMTLIVATITAYVGTFFLAFQRTGSCGPESGRRSGSPRSWGSSAGR
jgi:hypothetical protein